MNDITAQLQALQAQLGNAPMQSPFALPGMAPTYPPAQSAPQPTQPALPVFMTATDVDAMIRQRLQEFTPAPPPGPDLSRLHAVLQQVDGLARRALPEEDYKSLHGYLAKQINGATDFAEMLNGEALYPIMQLLWETIRENAK